MVKVLILIDFSIHFLYLIMDKNKDMANIIAHVTYCKQARYGEFLSTVIRYFK